MTTPIPSRVSGTLNAGQYLRLEGFGGRTLFVRDLTGTGVYLLFDEQKEVEIKKLDKFVTPQGEEFKEFALRNSSGSAISYEIIIYQGDITNTGTTITDPVIVNSGDTFTVSKNTLASGAAAQVLAASTSRNSVEIYNPSTTATVYIGSSNAVDATYRPLLPETAMAWDTGGAIWGYQNSGAGIDLVITEIKD